MWSCRRIIVASATSNPSSGRATAPMPMAATLRKSRREIVELKRSISQIYTLAWLGLTHSADGRNALRARTVGAMLRRSNYVSVSTPYLRLTHPLVRDGGRLRRASWNEALDRAASALRDARDRGPTRTYGMFSCSKATNEMNYIAQKFTRSVIGSNNIDSCNRT
jgi:Molybdopterin oxidoreductase